MKSLLFDWKTYWRDLACNLDKQSAEHKREQSELEKYLGFRVEALERENQGLKEELNACLSQIVESKTEML